jgi:hypothetical protein
MLVGKTKVTNVTVQDPQYPYQFIVEERLKHEIFETIFLLHNHTTVPCCVLYTSLEIVRPVLYVRTLVYENYS